MCGWLSAASICASRLKRARRSGSNSNALGSTFSATSRRSLLSRARNTSPIPPAPSSAMTRYGPTSAAPMKGAPVLVASPDGRASESASAARSRNGNRSVKPGSELAESSSDSISRRNASSPPVAAARNAARSAGGRSTAASNNALTCCQRASVMGDAPPRVHASAMPWPCATRASPSTPTPSTRVPLLRW